MAKRYLVTGGCGFIGTNLSLHLLKEKHDVTILDNRTNLNSELLKNYGAKVLNLNLEDEAIQSHKCFQNIDEIYHLAADVDNRFSWERPFDCINMNIKTTLNIGLAARNFQIPNIIYSSTGTIYGDNLNPPFLEDYENSNQTSLYGATKYGGEGILSVIATHFGISVDVFRFVGVLGPYSSHGHLFDFVAKLRANPTSLNVLGNGTQKKSYIHVDDVISGILKIRGESTFNVFNLGRADYSTVKDSVRWLIEEWKINPEVIYENSDRGWVGDNPFLQLDVSKAINAGWYPTISIEDAVKATVRWLIEN